MKTKVLIDTDILIDYLRDHEDGVRYLEDEKRELYTSAINVAELYTGVKNDNEMIAIKEFLTVFKIVIITKEIAESAGLIRNKYYKSHNIGLADAIIAACANSIDSVFVTLNKKHFPMFKSDQILTPYKK
jgi:predicted nucleic acid-binding protein